ncbi:hypothetical protein Mag101_06925 [Microbulbifer agarilyticus]|uniref:Uncharacterized protein n=1 Tax=Microbulbifer agarilyticus TaxID=260552 RepID=A0A1Q2M544_9GAMM|nr:hypothetical protein Mag101_06925 [Microbulbifer agarilyticus]
MRLCGQFDTFKPHLFSQRAASLFFNRPQRPAAYSKRLDTNVSMVFCANLAASNCHLFNREATVEREIHNTNKIVQNFNKLHIKTTCHFPFSSRSQDKSQVEL